MGWQDRTIAAMADIDHIILAANTACRRRIGIAEQATAIGPASTAG